MNAPVPAKAAPPRTQMIAGGPVAALVPQSLEEAFRVAGAIAASGLAPRGLDKQEQIMVAIMAGAELGLAPFQALQSFAVVNGRPTLYGDGLMAVARAQGVAVKEWQEGEGEALTAYCTVTRPDTGEEITRSFSIADAKKAALWGKQGPWQSYPRRMLAMRARAWALRDGCADFLRGFQVREEVEDYQPVRDVTPQPTGMRARLEARNADRAQGFDADHVARETGAMPAHDPETGEVTEAEFTDPPADDGLPVRDDTPVDDFPGDAPVADEPKPDLAGMKTGADLLAEKEAAKPTLAERVAKFKDGCAGAGTADLSKAWRLSSGLRNDLDAADPDAVADLTDWWQGQFDVAETREKGG